MKIAKYIASINGHSVHDKVGRSSYSSVFSSQGPLSFSLC